MTPNDAAHPKADGPGLSDTSEQAFKTTPDRARQAERERILEFIRCRGSTGATADEVERALQLPHQSASARISEMHRAFRIHFTDARRKTVRGKWARVYFSGPPPTLAALQGALPPGTVSDEEIRSVRDPRKEVELL